MQIIPVIDIKNGVVVHARAGDRASYRPIETPLASSAEPLAVIEGLLSLFPFDTLYLADLDGIERGEPDEKTQRIVFDAWPGSACSSTMEDEWCLCPTRGDRRWQDPNR